MSYGLTVDEYKCDNRRTGGERREDYFPTYVTGELRRLNRCLDALKVSVSDLRQQLNDHKILQAKEITVLQTKAGMVSGIISIFVSAGVATLFAWLIKP